jgi:hypothetical protein
MEYPNKFMGLTSGSFNSIRKVNTGIVSPPIKVATINDLSALNGQVSAISGRVMTSDILEICF